MSLLQRVFVSILGSQLLTQALLFYIPVHVYRTTGQAADLGIVFFLEWLPAIAIFPFAGRWIRHLSPVSVLRAVAAVRAVLLLGIAAGSLVHPVPPVVMYAGLLVFSVTMSFYRLAAEMLSARQFTQGEAAAAQAKVQTTDILAFVIGPALGGLCVDRLALETMFALSALAFIGLHAFVNGLRPPMPDGAEQAHAEVGFMQTLRFLFGHPMLRAHMMLNFSINLVTGFVLTMSVPIVVTAFGHPESHSAFTNAAGAAAAALLVSRLAPNTWFKSNGPVFGLVFFTLVMSAAARAATAESFALFAAAIVVFQAAIQGHNLYHRVERLKHIPPARFSQVLGALYLTFLLPLPLSGLAVRLIGPAISYRELILGATAAASLVGAVCYFSIFNLHRQKTVNA